MFFRTLLQAVSILPFLYATTSAQTACNNSPALCNRAYNNITHLGAHNSPFLRNENTSFSTSGNHYYDTTAQLESGVRLLTGQVHKINNTSGNQAWHMCHSSCNLLDAGTLQGWLGEVKTWMDKNPNDVVTVLLVNSDNATPAELGASFQASGIDQYAYTPPSITNIPQTWPTLQSMISNGTRLVTFIASLPNPSTEFGYLMNQYNFVFENDFNNNSPTDYSCNPNRPTNLGTPQQAANTGRMFLQNHFLYSQQLFGIQIPNSSYVTTTNGAVGLGSLGVALTACTAVYGKPASFVVVDFSNTGPAIASVDNANGVVGNISGRRAISSEPLDERPRSAAGPMRSQSSVFAVVVAVVAAVSFGI